MNLCRTVLGLVSRSETSSPLEDEGLVLEEEMEAVICFVSSTPNKTICISK